MVLKYKVQLLFSSLYCRAQAEGTATVSPSPYCRSWWQWERDRGKASPCLALGSQKQSRTTQLPSGCKRRVRAGSAGEIPLMPSTPALRAASWELGLFPSTTLWTGAREIACAAHVVVGHEVQPLNHPVTFAQELRTKVC